jgi:hypothetical protein
MLVPERGNSTLMNRAIRRPTARPVKRARRKDEVKASIVDMRPKEIAASATKAMATPFGPGTVAT